MVTENPPLLEPKRFDQSYVDHRLATLGDLKRNVDAHQGYLLAALASLEATVRDHLWVDGAFAEPAGRTLRQSLERTTQLLHRAQNLGAGFPKLPRAVDLVSVERRPGEGLQASQRPNAKRLSREERHAPERRRHIEAP